MRIGMCSSASTGVVNTSTSSSKLNVRSRSLQRWDRPASSEIPLRLTLTGESVATPSSSSARRLRMIGMS